eukprot:366002-Chlamydomonas_euryale.AAC.9
MPLNLCHQECGFTLNPKPLSHCRVYAFEPLSHHSSGIHPHICTYVGPCLHLWASAHPSARFARLPITVHMPAFMSKLTPQCTLDFTLCTLHFTLHACCMAAHRDDLLEVASILNGTDFDGDGDGDYSVCWGIRGNICSDAGVALAQGVRRRVEDGVGGVARKCGHRVPKGLALVIQLRVYAASCPLVMACKTRMPTSYDSQNQDARL